MRTILTLVLLLALALPPAVRAAPSCASDPVAAPALDLIEQAYNDLTLLYFQPIPAPTVLTPARDAVGEALATDPPAGEVADWMVFQDEFCSLWSDRSADATPDAVAYPAIEAFASALHEAHTQFYTPQMYQDYLAEASGDVRYGGIGTQVKADPLSIQRVFPGGPAAQAGLQPGDLIVAIDGEPAADLDATEAVRLIRGEEGTVVHLTIQRPGVPGQRDVELQRAVIQVPTIEARTVGDIAYLRIGDFASAGVADQVKTALQTFASQSAQGLILDLRGNPGGRLDVGTQVASYFLPARAAVYQETTHRGETSVARSTGDRIWDKPVDVLIDDGTASMGELLASALQESGGATLIGSQTAGAVAGSLVLPLKDGSAIQVTVQRIDSAQGTVLNEVGVTPDIPVDTTLTSTQPADDHPLTVALSDIQAKVARDQGAAASQPSRAAAPAGSRSQPPPPSNPGSGRPGPP